MNNRLFGLTFAGGDAREILSRVQDLPSEGPRQIVTANIDHVVTLADHARFREAYAVAAARTLDGMPLVWLARLRGTAAVRVTGHDLVAAAIAGPHRDDARIFMVSPSEGTAQNIGALFAAEGLAADRIAFEVPPHGFEHDVAYSSELRDRIRQHGTTLLLMGVGAPKSELWVHRQGKALGNPVVLNIGEAMNVAAGRVARAPLLLQRVGLEWLFRFASQPRRLFRRYFIRSWRFLALALVDRDLGSGRTEPVATPLSSNAAS